MLLYFRVLGWLEGLSLLALLFVAMPIKYLLGQPELVRYLGSVHGLLFVLYCFCAVGIYSKYKWSLKVLLLCLVLSCLPFGTFYFDKKIAPSSK